jgi:glycosyltransferase involved in cell wall biosynthesis
LQHPTHNAQVSVIIPVYNAVSYLEAALDSVLEQDWKELEIVAVNDGSSDDSGRILEEYRKRFPDRVQVIELGKNLGQSAALNAGIQASLGDYVKFLDADDLLAPGHLSAQMRALEGTDHHLSSCRWSGFVGSPEKGRLREALTDRDYEDPLAWILDSMEFDEGMMPGWRWLIPRKILERAGGWDERLSLNNDFEFSIRLALSAEGIRHAPDSILHYRQAVPGSLSKRMNRSSMESAWLTTRLGCDLILGKDDGPRARRLCADRMQDWLFRFYPEHAVLAREAEAAIKELGGSSRKLPGGRLLIRLGTILPWKVVRRMQCLAGALGWRKLKTWNRGNRRNDA